MLGIFRYVLAWSKVSTYLAGRIRKGSPIFLSPWAKKWEACTAAVSRESYPVKEKERLTGRSLRLFGYRSRQLRRQRPLDQQGL